jgi:hypothetical protein
MSAETIRLTHMSKASLLDNDDAGGSGKGRKRGEDVMSRVFNIIRIMRPFRGRKRCSSVCEAMVL